MLMMRGIVRCMSGWRGVRGSDCFLRNYVLFEEPETNRKFDNLFRQADKISIMNTVEYLRMEGREEATVSFVQNLLKQSDFAVEKIASLANVSVEFVNKIKSKLNGAK